MSGQGACMGTEGEEGLKVEWQLWSEKSGKLSLVAAGGTGR